MDIKKELKRYFSENPIEYVDACKMVIPETIKWWEFEDDINPDTAGIEYISDDLILRSMQHIDTIIDMIVSFPDDYSIPGSIAEDIINGVA